MVRRTFVGHAAWRWWTLAGLRAITGQAARRTGGMGNAHGLPVGWLCWLLHGMLPRIGRGMPTACPWDGYVLC